MANIEQVDDGNSLLTDTRKPLKLLVNTLFRLVPQVLERSLTSLSVDRPTNVLDPFCLLRCEASATNGLLYGCRLSQADLVPRLELGPQIRVSRVRVCVRRVLRQNGADDGAQDIPALPSFRWPTLAEDGSEMPVKRNDICRRRALKADEGRASKDALCPETPPALAATLASALGLAAGFFLTSVDG
eukprot:CAMPEP_0176122766 /NCGR_PEP_ID=MMETSP0120_2-20121206/61839_1 /TAXON_ID=160619 /ORGANISM="Kryptoperidinium foliaceum, Strain CCMP 1326" /LENGTH=186 /DNA_ID=CAMNT_0017457411 /DNA_START=406 /DNA_END=963 /DNA_ORIENTATION=-